MKPRRILINHPHLCDWKRQTRPRWRETTESRTHAWPLSITINCQLWTLIAYLRNVWNTHVSDIRALREASTRLTQNVRDENKLSNCTYAIGSDRCWPWLWDICSDAWKRTNWYLWSNIKLIKLSKLYSCIWSDVSLSRLFCCVRNKVELSTVTSASKITLIYLFSYLVPLWTQKSSRSCFSSQLYRELETFREDDDLTRRQRHEKTTSRETVANRVSLALSDRYIDGRDTNAGQARLESCHRKRRTGQSHKASERLRRGSRGRGPSWGEMYHRKCLIFFYKNIYDVWYMHCKAIPR